jgi:tetratricopeptide (TPR) repeat protein
MQTTKPNEGYSARDVARLLDLSVGQVRSYARSGFLDPTRGERGEYRFSFQDLVLLRTAKGLEASRIAPRKVRTALADLKKQLPSGRPLSGVQIVAQGDEIVVRHGDVVWNPKSKQSLFDFEVSELEQKVTPHALQVVRETHSSEEDLDEEDWFMLGSDLESTSPEHAREAYRRALELDPTHVDARVNLGRMLHEVGRLTSAESHYRLALAARPKNATALFNLGVSLEDLGQDSESAEAYSQAIEIDPKCADAYFNLARLEEKAGNSEKAIRLLTTHRKLTGKS